MTMSSDMKNETCFSMFSELRIGFFVSVHNYTYSHYENLIKKELTITGVLDVLLQDHLWASSSSV